MTAAAAAAPSAAAASPGVGGMLAEGGGSLISSGASLLNARWNRQLQKRSMTHGVRLKVADMRAAGINPLLAAGPGGAAPMPSGSAANVSNPAENATLKSLARTKMTHEVNLLNAQSGSAREAGKMNKALGFKHLQDARVQAKIADEYDKDPRLARLAAMGPHVPKVAGASAWALGKAADEAKVKTKEFVNKAIPGKGINPKNEVHKRAAIKIYLHLLKTGNKKKAAQLKKKYPQIKKWRLK